MKKRNGSFSEAAFFLGFAGPAVFCFAMVIVIPFFYGFYLTLTNWNGISATKDFVGITNYLTAFSDLDFWHSILLTVEYSAISVVLVNLIAFILACLVTSGIRNQNIFRTVFFIPNLIGGLVLGYIWQFIFSRAFVTLGTSLHLGFFSQSWLSSPDKALLALILVSVWQYSGFMMLIYISGLMGVPRDLLDAAKIDGCTEFQSLRMITIPMISSSFVICIFLSITRCFMAYDLNLSLTEGGPFGSTIMASMHVYQKAFTSKQYGQGQTEAVILFLICAVISILQVIIGNRKEVQS